MTQDGALSIQRCIPKVTHCFGPRLHRHSCFRGLRCGDGPRLRSQAFHRTVTTLSLLSSLFVFFES